MKHKTETSTDSLLQDGVVLSTILASGIGCAIFGLFVTLSESNASVKQALTIMNSVGPLSGKVVFSFSLWIVVWVILHINMKNKQLNHQKIYKLSFFFILLGLLGTFPPFYQAVAELFTQ
ncbi:hypothetical protein [Neobacillus niacini]|uniref:hypothetical protein n=1 Tax=Neobacillus niacini TaxID=86668 RepID=UPI00285A9124|nr:hypothetical protein [Neobacillus niacini]MDR7000029.1 hypothetical protein [Neobacillus niacini]